MVKANELNNAIGLEMTWRLADEYIRCNNNNNNKMCILTVAKCTCIFAVLTLLKHSQRLEQVDVLRESRWGRSHLHVSGPLRYALGIPPVTRLTLKK